MAVATLAMYDLPEARAHTDAFWSCLAGHLKGEGLDGVPDNLDRTVREQEAWRRDDLVMSQSCGYPVLTKFSEDLRLIATPEYAVDGCDGTDYRSALIVHKDSEAQSLADLRGSTVAVNNWDSQSGYNTLRAALVGVEEKGEPFFSRAIVSGGHRFSIASVASKQADVAAVDSVTLAMVGKYAPAELENIRIVGWTGVAPSLPFVTKKSAPDEVVEKMRTALKNTFSDKKSQSARDGMFLSGYRVLPLSDYSPITDMIEIARSAGILFAADGKPERS